MEVQCPKSRVQSPGVRARSAIFLTLDFGHSTLDSIWPEAKWRGHPFSRSYGAILPSSLERFLSRALVYSTHPPVSVYGTGSLGNSSMLFSASCLVIRFGRSLSSAFDCLVTFLLASIRTLIQAGAGILICCASITPYGLILAPD
jgi:hypothetical protein